MSDRLSNAETVILDELAKCVAAVEETSVSMQQDRFHDFCRGVLAIEESFGTDISTLEDVIESCLHKFETKFLN
jgi:septation ring formation regulator EzrA